MTKAARREKNQRIVMQLKADRIERTTGRCPICNKVIHADFLKAGMANHAAHDSAAQLTAAVG